MSKHKQQDWSGYEFPGQHEGEIVGAAMRLHMVIMRKGLLAFSLIFMISSFPYLLFPDRFVLMWFILLGMVLGGLFLFQYWIKWYYSLILVTNLRFIMLKQKGIFSNSVIEVGLDKIQNVNYQVDGLEQTLLGFGTINVQTFAGDLIVEHVAKPRDVQDAINKAIVRHRDQHGTEE